MKLRETSECPNCKPIARRLAKLEQQLAETLQRVDKLEQELRGDATILVAEDTPFFQGQFERILQNAGYRRSSSTTAPKPWQR